MSGIKMTYTDDEKSSEERKLDALKDLFESSPDYDKYMNRARLLVEQQYVGYLEGQAENIVYDLALKAWIKGKRKDNK